MESSVKQRLIDFINLKKISIREFERLCNLSNGYVKGVKHSILPEKMRGISLQYPDLNPIWLLMGEGEMLLSDKSNTDKSENVKPENSPSEILEELRENYLVKEERLLAIIESQQEVIKNQSEVIKKIQVGTADGAYRVAAEKKEQYGYNVEEVLEGIKKEFLGTK